MSNQSGQISSSNESNMTEIEKEKEWVLNLRKGKKIKLNVGGIYYTTTLTTLQSEPTSMLAAMFSGRFPIEKDEDDGAFFIDRNGRVFRHILDWLRTKKLSPDLSNEDMFWLKEEAKYYQLSDLETTLQSLSQLDNSLSYHKATLVPTIDQWRVKKMQSSTPSIMLPAIGNSKSPFSFALNNSDTEEAWFEEEILPYLEQGYKASRIANRVVLTLEDSISES